MSMLSAFSMREKTRESSCCTVRLLSVSGWSESEKKRKRERTGADFNFEPIPSEPVKSEQRRKSIDEVASSECFSNPTLLDVRIAEGDAMLNERDGSNFNAPTGDQPALVRLSEAVTKTED